MTLNHRSLSAIVVTIAVLGLIPGAAGCSKSPKTTASARERPNIVLLIIDALRSDKLGNYGFPLKDISPEIDAMAEDGVVFETVYSQCSWTRPSIASMVTGLYPRSTGIFKEQYDILHDRYLTLAEILRDHGYRTYGITANPNINKLFNFHQGFDDYQDSNVVWKWMPPESDQEKTGRDTHLPQSREIFETILEKAAEYKREAPNRPVYIQVDIMEVHSPYLLRKENKNLYGDYPVRKINYNYSRKKLENLVRGTLAAVRQASSDTGDFVQRLRKIPGWSDTLVIITSDHGQGLDDHPDVAASAAHGNLLYESHLKVPLIFYHPETRKRKYTPHRVPTMGRLLDLMPTILDYVDIPLPQGHNIDGVSLMNLVTGSGPAPVIPEYFAAETSWRDIDKMAVYSGQWKYFVNKDKWSGVNDRELQAIGVTENGKLTDRIGEHPETAKKMIAWLARWLSRVHTAKRSFPEGKLSPKEIEQLKSLGYLQ